MAIYRSETTTIDLHDLYLPEDVIDSLSIEDQITYHQNCYNHWVGLDDDYSHCHKIALRELMDEEDTTLYL